MLESWERKVGAITGARDLDYLAMDDLIGYFITYELKKNQKKDIGTKRNDKAIALKTTEIIDYDEKI